MKFWIQQAEAACSLLNRRMIFGRYTFQLVYIRYVWVLHSHSSGSHKVQAPVKAS